MKLIFESSKTFQAYAIIDFCYYMIKEIQKSGNKPRSLIEMEIDRVTGYTEYQNKKNMKIAISLLRQIIKQKKIIEADYTNDENILKSIQELKLKYRNVRT